MAAFLGHVFRVVTGFLFSLSLSLERGHVPFQRWIFLSLSLPFSFSLNCEK